MRTVAKRSAIRSERALADLVDHHDTASLWSGMEPVPARIFQVRRRPESSIRVALPAGAWKRVRVLATRQHVPPDKLVGQWLAERIREEARAG